MKYLLTLIFGFITGAVVSLVGLFSISHVRVALGEYLGKRTAEWMFETKEEPAEKDDRTWRRHEDRVWYPVPSYSSGVAALEIFSQISEVYGHICVMDILNYLQIDSDFFESKHGWRNTENMRVLKKDGTDTWWIVTPLPEPMD